MTCPHCHAGFLPDGARRCPLCGQLRSGGHAAVPADIVPENDFGAVDQLVTTELGSQFRIERALKHGRASHVYFARDSSGREFALKVVRLPAGTTPEDAERFDRAARAAARFVHPSVVRLCRHGATDTMWWYATEYVRAPSVAERLASGAGSPLDVPLTWRIARQVAIALDDAHGRGLVHGALTPRDLLLDDAGGVTVLDVGLAETLRPITKDPANPYLAPECSTGAAAVGPLADQYSLAVVVRECLTGVAPRDGGAPDFAGLPSAAGRHVARVLGRALAPIPGDRFPSVFAFVAALEGRETAPRRFGVLGRATPPPRVLFDPEDQPPPRRRLRRVGIAAAVLVVGGVLWVGAQTSPRASGAPVPAPPEAEAPRPAPPPPAGAPAPAPAPARASLPARNPPRRPDRAKAPSTAPRPGYLSVNARPWAMLSVDGRLIGNTPRVKVRLPAGLHHFRLQRAGFRPYEAAIEIRPGETVLLTNIVLEAVAR